MTAAAGELIPETIRVITSTTVVIQATNRGPRTSTWSGVLVLDMMVLLAALCRGMGGRAPWCWFLAAPSAARESAATQRLQQQQQPATRHRSTARRLVSNSSTRVDMSDSLPNYALLKPTAQTPLSVSRPVWA